MRFEFREKMIMIGVIDFCAEGGLCEGSKGNGMRPFGSSCCTL